MSKHKEGSTTEITSGAPRISGSAGELSKLADEPDRMVGHFKI